MEIQPRDRNMREQLETELINNITVQSQECTHNLDIKDATEIPQI
jgi:hypothetical protein